MHAMDRSTEGVSGALSMAAQAQTLSVRNIVPMEAEVVHVGVSSTTSETLYAGCLAANAGSPGTSNASRTSNVASNTGITEDSYDTETETDELGGFGNGIEDPSELKATDADIEQYSTLISYLEEGFQDFTNESSSSDFGSDETDEILAQALAKKSLKMYAHGMLPTEDDTAMPKDPIVGFRGETFSLKLLFGRVVGV
jgi:predicted secreted protein